MNNNTTIKEIAEQIEAKDVICTRKSENLKNSDIL